MRVFAYCTEIAQASVAAATGVLPVTSPPVTALEFDRGLLEGHDLLYFRLHRLLDRKGWWGEGRHGGMLFALARAQVQRADLGGAIVVVANCHGADDDPMVEALHEAGAAAGSFRAAQ